MVLIIISCGTKTEKDVSICLGTFRGMTSENWLKMCSIEGNVLVTEEIKHNPSKDDLRALRLARFTALPIPPSDASQAPQ